MDYYTGQVENTSQNTDNMAPVSAPAEARAKKLATYVGYFGVILIPFVAFLLGLTVGYNQAKQDITSWYGPSSGSTLTSSGSDQNLIQAPKVDLSLFWQVLKKVENQYVHTEKIDYASMSYGAIKGMVASLGDPYTAFLTPKESKDLEDTLNGDLEGIGAELAAKDGQLVVVSPIKGSPAEKAGLKPGDIIMKINDESVINTTLNDAVTKIRGKPGTSVKLSLMRKGNDALVDMTIERQAIKVPSVELEFLPGNIAHLNIQQFGSDTKNEVLKAINQILIKKPKGVILDVRNDGGGYLTAAIDIASDFIEDGVVTIVRKRELDGSRSEEINRTHGNARLGDIPLVVLVNEGSASASEILAGALQDLGRAKIVGKKTFGKGTVQELVDLSDGSTLRITTSEWFTPNNINVHGKGITPDVEVEFVLDEKDPKKDNQLDKAVEVLLEVISNPGSTSSPEFFKVK